MAIAIATNSLRFGIEPTVMAAFVYRQEFVVPSVYLNRGMNDANPTKERVCGQGYDSD